MDIEKRLMEAIEDGEVLRVTYAGGSQPGAERDIAPISVKDGKVRARCYSSGAVKLFVVNKITILSSAHSEGQAWKPGQVKALDWNTLAEVVEAHREEWQAVGWRVISDEEHIGLHTYGKRKLLKYPTVALLYDPVVHEVYMDLDGDFVEPDRERERPWVVSAPGFNKATFKNFSKAANRFIEWSRQVTPNPRPPTK